MPKKEDLAAWITGLVDRFLTESPLNNLQNKDGAPAWDEALVGFASGADPLFQEYKEYIGPFHWTPLEIYNPYSGKVFMKSIQFNRLWKERLFCSLINTGKIISDFTNKHGK